MMTSCFNHTETEDRRRCIFLSSFVALLSQWLLVKYLPFGEELMQNLFFLSTALHQKVEMEGFGEIEEHCGR
jgi:hypothetical protein